MQKVRRSVSKADGTVLLKEVPGKDAGGLDNESCDLVIHYDGNLIPTKIL